ncbi:DAK2 domain-containing protein [Kocuria coralli]|uniref:DAK2 domain-containing protein n=1 Tax=Kocuria coralli TaxID=1461025 RepID=UPI001FEC3F6A|nr:DAK2 domain-containing protein [Kocuria coralli]
MNHKKASNATAVRRWLEMAARDLQDHADVLNALNVFPVADEDTGTNLALTVSTASEAAGVLETPDLSELVTLAGQAALEEARGNSGTLFSVFLTALGHGLEGADRLTAAYLADAMSAGSVRAWSVLSDPVPGTMLSVLREAAAVGVPREGEAGSNQQLAAYLLQLVGAAQEAVLASSHSLEVLRGTRKVDAGALGMLIILDALRRAVAGHEPAGPQLWAGSGEATDGAEPDAEEIHPVDEVLARIGYDLYPPVDDADTAVLEALREANSGVEIMATLDLTALDAAAVRYELAERGDSVIVSAVSQLDDDTWRWRVHVHVEDQQMALEVLRGRGTPRNITVTGLAKEDRMRRVRVDSADLD